MSDVLVVGAGPVGLTMAVELARHGASCRIVDQLAAPLPCCRAIGITPGLPLLGSEKAIELNYAAYIRPYLLFQPVFQYYDDVGANPHIPNAAVFGFRVKVDF